ncbi:hypothetical protein Vadar_019856 [Vaccinium darrowii]|uniref:Uncharacterized protein n=1 Tax=Vaccinium darrowii TaxID=229202 RepID=A0ACB7XRP9_9ERIC|nr:hypothetical protein Vadar_019856 [Vaccinium darrowii]
MLCWRLLSFLNIGSHFARRVSSEVSNRQVILNVDCDMYSMNSCSVRDELCFFMDEENGHEIAYMQFPQNYENLTKNEVYSSSLKVLGEFESMVWTVMEALCMLELAASTGEIPYVA